MHAVTVYSSGQCGRAVSRSSGGPQRGFKASVKPLSRVIRPDRRLNYRQVGITAAAVPADQSSTSKAQGEGPGEPGASSFSEKQYGSTSFQTPASPSGQSSTSSAQGQGSGEPGSSSFVDDQYGSTTFQAPEAYVEARGPETVEAQLEHLKSSLERDLHKIFKTGVCRFAVLCAMFNTACQIE